MKRCISTTTLLILLLLFSICPLANSEQIPAEITCIRFRVGNDIHIGVMQFWVTDTEGERIPGITINFSPVEGFTNFIPSTNTGSTAVTNDRGSIEVTFPLKPSIKVYLLRAWLPDNPHIECYHSMILHDNDPFFLQSVEDETEDEVDETDEIVVDNPNVVTHRTPIYISSATTDETDAIVVDNPNTVTDRTPTDISATASEAPKIEQQAMQVVKTLDPIIITEYLLKDRPRYAIGYPPQWIELYNPNNEPVSLKGWVFTYAHREFVNYPWQYTSITIAENTEAEDGEIIERDFQIPENTAVILATKSARYWGGIGIEDQVYVLEINNYLKNGWHITDNEGNEVYRIGKAFNEYGDDPQYHNTEWTRGNPQLPGYTKGTYRVAYQVYPSGGPKETHFYGYGNDIGTPGYFEDVVPSAPTLKVFGPKFKRTTTWAQLKSSK